MSRRVVITGLGPVNALGLGIEPTWDGLRAGRTGVARIDAWDPAGFASQIAAQVRDLKVSNFVPKSYRKATKVMARDIELAVAAADLAARDARLATRGTMPEGSEFKPSYPPARVGCQIGAGLIAAELNELTSALAESRDEGDQFDIHKWGSTGITHLTPLWLLKYLPNMLACHVTIIHDAQGPSNTITCAEASGLLSIGESLRVIQRGAADLCFCGGADSKVNPMGFLRQQMAGLLNTSDNASPQTAVRPFSISAAGTAAGEGGGIVILESLDTFEQRRQRDGARAYAEVLGFGASQSVHREARNLRPDPQGKGIAVAIRAALRDAGIGPDQIDLIVPFGLGVPEFDTAEASALATLFGDRLQQIPLRSIKAMVGNCAAGAGALDVCAAAKALAEQTLPAAINCSDPRPGLRAGAEPAQAASIRCALALGCSTGGQTAALVLRRYESKTDHA